MARIPRTYVLDESEVGVYHCINRCVRRAFLCGTDAATGHCFDHRKQWIQDRLEYLAGQFGIDVLGFAVMSNHLHAVLRNRPDVVAQWSDEEVVGRWWMLFPKRRKEDGSPADPQEHELQMLAADADKLAELRKRLSSLSWFMRCLAEPIARASNREDKCTGRFWEGRFKCQPLLDESAVAACMAYVDLNPIRARIAKTPQSSRFTSIYERMQSMKAENGRQEDEKAKRADGEAEDKSLEHKRPAAPHDGWLSPVELARDERSERKPVRTRRASNKGCLAMSLADYLRLLDWTGRQLRRDKRGAIPADVSGILERLQISEAGWIDLVHDFGRLFHRAAGRPASLACEAERCSRRWLQGISHSRNLFA